MKSSYESDLNPTNAFNFGSGDNFSNIYLPFAVGMGKEVTGK